MTNALPLNGLPQMLLRKAPAGLRAEALAAGLRTVTSQLEPQDLLGFVERDASLYHDYLWPAEQAKLLQFLQQNRSMALELRGADLLDLLEPGRPDLVTLLRAVDRDFYGAGTAWLTRQWTEMLDLIGD